MWCSVSCTGIRRIPNGVLRRHCISIYTHTHTHTHTHTIIFISIIIYIIISLICLSVLKDT